MPDRDAVEAAAAAFAAGRGISEAASAAAVSRRTVERWLQRGRGELAEPFAKLALALDHPPPPEPDSLPDRAELLRRLDQQSRNGSTKATDLLLKHAPIVSSGEQVDELARLRALHAEIEARQ